MSPPFWVAPRPSCSIWTLLLATGILLFHFPDRLPRLGHPRPVVRRMDLLQHHERHPPIQFRASPTPALLRGLLPRPQADRILGALPGDRLLRIDRPLPAFVTDRADRTVDGGHRGRRVLSLRSHHCGGPELLHPAEDASPAHDRGEASREGRLRSKIANGFRGFVGSAPGG